MSETAPYSNPRLENFEANKKAYEDEVKATEEAEALARYQDELFGEAGTDGHYGAEDVRRLEEVDMYERHLKKLEDRQEVQEKRELLGIPFAEEIDDSYVKPHNMDSLHAEGLEMNAAVDAEEDARIAALMQSSPSVRQMQMLAEDIARIGGTVVTPENDAKLAESLKDKEDRLQELLVKFTEQSNYPKTDVDAITSRLIDMTEPAPVEVDDDDSNEPGVDATEPDADAPDAPKADSADKADALPAPLHVTPDAVDVNLPAPLGVTPDATDALPAPLDVTPDANASIADTLPAPLEVTPDAHRDKFADLLNHPAVTTRNWMRTKGDSLKARLDKFRGRPTKEKAHVILNGVGMFAVAGLLLYTAKHGHDTGAISDAASNYLSPSGGGNVLAMGDSMNVVSAAGEQVFSAAGNVASGIGDVITFTAEALTVVKGEGWTRTLTEAGASQSEIQVILKELLTTTDPAIKEWVYTMKDGNPGISHSGQMPADVLQSIMKMRG